MTKLFARTGIPYKKEHLPNLFCRIEFDIQVNSWQEKHERRFAPTYLGSNGDLNKLEQVISINWNQRSQSFGLGDLFHRNTQERLIHHKIRQARNRNRRRRLRIGSRI